jgi:hypothetical protein
LFGSVLALGVLEKASGTETDLFKAEEMNLARGRKSPRATMYFDGFGSGRLPGLAILSA